MTLNETQSAAVCLGFCAMYKIADAARERELSPNIYINEMGTLEVHVATISKYFFHLKDRTPKEIDDFVNITLDAISNADIR
jgi:hypothetical protein